MTLPTIVGIASCLSSLAVVTSLIFVIRQLDLSIRHQRATARHGRVQQLQMLYLQASQGDFIEILIRGLDGDTALAAKDCNRFVWFVAAAFNMFEEMFHQLRDEIIDDATFASSISSMRPQLGTPGMRAAWMVIRGRYEKNFAEYVDRLIADTPVDLASDVSSIWRGFAAASARGVGPAE
jgi:hypothetical protein